MFDSIAGRYDFINRVLALRMDISWRRHMARELKERLDTSQENNYYLLDVATGTADVALQLSKEFGASDGSVKILGVDPSQNMLAVGRQKVKARNLQQRITLEQADARDLSGYESNTFDAATMSFGIRNVPSPRSTALCEIHRLLKPNGVLAILEFSKPSDEHGVLGAIARLFIVHAVPILGGILSGKPREYLHLQNSIQDFPTPTEFNELLETLQCPHAFDMEPVQHLNFGSVQLYIGRAVKNESDAAEATATQQESKGGDPLLPPLKATASAGASETTNTA